MNAELTNAALENAYEIGLKDGYAEGVNDTIKEFETWLANEFYTFERIRTIPELLSRLHEIATERETKHATKELELFKEKIKALREKDTQ